MKAKCRAKEKQQENGTGLVAKEEETENIFMASSSTEFHPSSVFLVDSGCLNHMTGDRILFSSLDESLQVSVRFGDNKEMKVHGIGIVTVHTHVGDQKNLNGV